MLNLALVGVGKWGIRYLETIKGSSSCKVKYICSPHINNYTWLPSTYIKVQNYKLLLNYSDIDGVIIASSSETHLEIASFFIKSGVNVLIEKPITTSLQEAIKLREIASKSKSIAMTSQVYHYNPAFIKMKQLLSSIGGLNLIEFVSGKYQPENSSSALWEWGPHDVSMCLDLVETMPKQVSAWSQKGKGLGEMIFIRLVFNKNIQALIITGWMTPQKTRKCVAFGTSGYIAFDDLSSKKLMLFNGKKTIFPKYSDSPSLFVQVQEFILAIKKVKKTETDISYSVQAMKVLDAAERSAESNGKIYNI